ncbi:MAG: DUF1573 domain-containing protein [Candidatus Kapaibacteriales bacterium]
MRKLIVFVTFFLLPILTFSQPKLEIIGGDTYNWGTVKSTDDPLKAKVKLRNAGTELLKISAVKPGCGCTTAPLDKSELNPGEEATLDITLHIGGAGNEVTKSIRISSNDPNEPNKYLYLKATVFHPISLSPTQYFTFNEMTVGKESMSKLTLKNNTNREVKLSNVEFSPADLSLNLPKEKILKPGETFELIAKVTPQKKGYFNCSVKIQTTDPDMKEIVIPGYGNVKESPIFNNN